ncbi:unnamed protein product [Symbiodinium sp. CCMP2592]|nr:unnamed protein product [Symbiodinium sp. CCMP2592]
MAFTWQKVNPDGALDLLPLPYRIIDEVVEDIVEAVGEQVDIIETRKRSETCEFALPEAIPTSLVQVSGHIACAYVEPRGTTRMAVGTSQGEALLIDSRKGEVVAHAHPFHESEPVTCVSICSESAYQEVFAGPGVDAPSLPSPNLKLFAAGLTTPKILVYDIHKETYGVMLKPACAIHLPAAEGGDSEEGHPVIEQLHTRGCAGGIWACVLLPDGNVRCYLTPLGEPDLQDEEANVVLDAPIQEGDEDEDEEVGELSSVFALQSRAWPNMIVPMQIPPDDDAEHVDVVAPLPSEIQIIAAAQEQDPKEATALSEDFLAELAGCMVPISPDLLRATKAGDAFRGFGKALRGSKKLYQLSYQTKKINQFWSHSWHGSTWRKYVTLLLFYNGAAAAAVACLGAAVASVLFALELLPVLREPNKVTYWQSFWAALVGMILYLLVLLFYRPQVPIFLDVICIDQSNPRRKGQGLLSMGAFLKASRSMLILWDATYSDRLWTMFEFAAFLTSREKGETPKVVLRPTILGPCYLVLMLTLILALTIGDNVACDLSASGRYSVWAFQFLICCGGLSVNTAAFRAYFRTVSNSQKKLAGWRLADVKCSCCDTGHVRGGGICDRKVVMKCIHQWFGSLDDFESHVRTEIRDTFVHEQSSQPFTYTQVVIALVPVIWSYLDRASAHARFTSWDPWMQAASQIARGLAWWLGVGPMAFLIQCRLACRFQRESRWPRCDPLLNLLPLLAVVLVVVLGVVTEQLFFKLTLFRPGHEDNMLLFALIVICLAWLLYACVGAGPRLVHAESA